MKLTQHEGKITTSTGETIFEGRYVEANRQEPEGTIVCKIPLTEGVPDLDDMSEQERNVLVEQATEGLNMEIARQRS